MSNESTAARGQRAALCEEFIGPILKETRDGYLARIAEIAATELDSKVRADKIAALAIALKVLGNVTNGLNSAIEAGRLAERNVMQAHEIERMSPSRRHLFGLVPTR